MARFLKQYGFRLTRVETTKHPYRLILVRFNEWLRGIVSFDIVRKIEEKKVGNTMRGTTSLTKKLRVLAMFKTYLLFGIPAFLLYLYLRLTKQLDTELYVRAESAP